MKNIISFNSFFLALALLVSLPDICNSQTITSGWSSISDFVGTERSETVSFTLGDLAFVGLGNVDGEYKKDFYKYNPTNDTWTPIKDFPGTPRANAVAFTIGDFAYVGTGYDGSFAKDFYKYNPTNDTWAQIADFDGAPRSGAVAFTIGNYAYVGTGLEDDINGGFKSRKDFYKYNPTNDTWTQIADFDGTPRWKSAAFTIDNAAYVGTGSTLLNGDYKDDFFKYDPEFGTWTQINDFSGTARHGAASFGNLPYVGLGLSNNYENDVYKYDHLSGTWIQIEDFPGSARRNATSISIGNIAYMGCGQDAFSAKKDFYKYTLPFFATDGDNDAYIDLTWVLSLNECVPTSESDYPNGVLLELLADGNVIQNQNFGNVALLSDPIIGTFRHDVGPEQSVNYEIRIRENGPGTTLCSHTISGSTLPFQKPVIIESPDDLYPDSIHIEWTNNSKLSDNFVIYRDGEVIATIDGTDEVGAELKYTDIYQFNDTTSLVNSETYQYCIETFSSIINETFPQVCKTDSTYNIGFSASDDEPENKVRLEWRDLSSFCDKLHILRNGITIAILNSDKTSFEDESPIFGRKSEYGLLLVRDNASLLMATDTGSVPKNGTISGRVLTETGLYPVRNVKILIEGQAGDTTIIDSVYTDFDGSFQFVSLYYDQVTTFSLTASKSGHKFIEPIKEIELNSAFPEQLDLIFIEENGIPEINDNSSLDAEFIPPVINETAENIFLAWTYTYVDTDTTFFNLYRGSNLIARLNDAGGPINNYEDVDALPGESLEYQLTIFRIIENAVQDSVISDTLNDNAIFPIVQPINEMIALANNDSGFIYVDWFSHPSQNYKGFRLFRNGALLDTFPPGIFNYIDKYAPPGALAEYQIQVYRVVDDLDFPSEMAPTPVASALFPPLLAAENAFASPDSNKDLVQLTWQIPLTLTLDYNYDGFNIYRKKSFEEDFQLIGTKYKYFCEPGSTITFDDLTGIPNTQYDYRISTWIEAPTINYETHNTIENVTFPPVTKTSTLSAIPKVGKVTIIWDVHSSVNNDGFILYANEDSLQMIGTGKNNTNIFINNPPNTSVNYKVRSFRYVDDQFYYSEAESIDATPLTGDSAPVLPTNFTATSDLPDHVKLCWEYDPATFSKFIIRRNDVILDTLLTTTRAYYDYEANISSEYSITAVYLDNTSQPVLATGGLRQNKRIYGKVKKALSGQGVPGILMTAKDQFNFYFDQVYTDSTGYFQFDNVLCLQNYTIEVSAKANNSDFSNGGNKDLEDTQNIEILLTQQDYSVSFLDYYEPESGTEIAEPTAVTAYPDPSHMGVTISWSPSNSNYSGFEILRSNVVIAEILQGEELIFVDTEGTPGVSYGYSAQAFLDVPLQDRIYSSAKGASAQFPILEAPIKLTGTPDPDLNQLILRWSHPYNNHDYYRLERNGTLLSTINCSEDLKVYDSTGVPGQLYEYNVIAIKGNYESMATSIEVTYPAVAEVKNLVASVPYETIYCYEEEGIFSTSYESKNHILLTFEYENDGADGFEIYRNSDPSPIAILDGDLRTFKDYSIIPYLNYDYKVVAYVNRNEVSFYSGINALIPSDNAIAPELMPFSSIQVIANENKATVEIEIKHSEPGVDGYYIERNGEYIDTLPFASPDTLLYVDKTGIPNTQYFYGVESYSIQEFGEIRNSGCTVGVQYPALLVPQNVTASEATLENPDFFNYIDINWQYPTETGIDSFEIREYNSTSILTTVSASKRNFKEVFSIPGNAGSNKIYEIRAIKEIDGEPYYSEWISSNAGSAGIANANNLPDNVLGGINSGMGYDVAIDGDWAVVGAPNNEPSGAYIYKKIEDSWSFEAILGYNQGSEAGYSVDISGDWIIIGAPADNGLVKFYHYNGESWLDQTTKFGTGLNNRFGHSVSIDGDYAVIGEPYYDPETDIHQGRIKIYKKNGTQWDEQFSYSGANYTALGKKVSISGDYCFVTRKTEFSFPENYAVKIFKNTGSNWVDAQDFLFSAEGSLSVSVHGDHALVGDPLDGSGKTYFLEYDDDTWSNQGVLPHNSVGPNPNDNYGSSVAITEDYAIVGAKNAHAVYGVNFVGEAYLYYQNDNGNWEEIETIEFPAVTNVSDFDDFGFSVALSAENYIIGDPGADVPSSPAENNNGTASLYNLVWQPTNVQATDGDFPTKTKITWNYDEKYKPGANGFKIFRENSATEIGVVSVDDNYSYDDTGGVPGKTHVYSVVAYQDGGVESLPASATGYRFSDGMISGTVQTLTGNSPVAGVALTATAIVEGGCYEYQTTTNIFGEFTFEDVYYGEDEDGVSYTVVPEFETHVFEPNTATVILRPALPQNLVSFFDKTAYIVKGFVHHENVICGMEGVGVHVNYFTGAGQPETKETFTDEDGYYTLVVDPNKANLQELQIEIDNFLVINKETSDVDTIYYENFNSNEVTSFTDFEDFPLETEINFMEETVYPAKLIVQNACELPISENSYDIRVRSLDGCYDQYFTTNNLGEVTVNLPPLNFVLSVTDVDNPTPEDLTAVNYFASHPTKLNLYDIHWQEAADLTNNELAALTARNFTFHKAPEITVSGFDNFFCGDLANIALLYQKSKTHPDPVTLNFTITENHNGNTCPVKEGFVKVVNPASTESAAVLIPYDKSSGDFPSYRFTVGNPNVVSPHIYGVSFEYLSNEKDFLGKTIKPVFVDGQVAVPGTDIIVDPSHNDQVPFPLFVLRDPPGDGSFSSIASGQTFSETVEVTSEANHINSAFANGSTSHFGPGLSLNVTAGDTRTDTDAANWSYELTTTQTISTSSDDSFVGRGADIIVGMGLAMQYGFVQKFTSDCDTIIKTTAMGVTPGGVNTTWTFTVQQIEDVIKGYQNDSMRVEAGTLKIKWGDNEEPLPKARALSLLNSYITNWRGILEYHSVKTLPHYLLCANVPDDIISPAYKTEIDNWKIDFCPSISDGAYTVDGEFKLKKAKDINWDNELMNKYNAGATAIRNLSYSKDLGQANLIKYQWDSNASLEGYFDPHYDNLYGVLAQNKTFGGGTIQSTVINSAQANSKSYGYGYTMELSESVSLDFSNEVQTIAATGGIGVILGAITTVNKTDIQIGQIYQYETTASSSREYAETNTVEISYELTDDESGDQFSTSIIQGPTQNHTPYFYLFGGKSSCPVEKGTIPRDDPQMMLFDEESNTTTNNQSKYNIPADGAAEFLLRIESNTPFPTDDRSLFVFLNNSSNTNGAQVRLNGQLLGDQVYCDLPANESQTFSLTVERGVGSSYSHEDLEIIVQAWCSDPGSNCTGNGFASDTTQSVFVSAYFQSPCSPVTLVKPEDNWVVSSADNKLVMGIRDYQPENENLDEIQIQYRRLGQGDQWDLIPSYQLDPNDKLTRTVLQAYNAGLDATQIPEYPLTWDIPDDDVHNFIDGDYQLRAVAVCDAESTTSNILPGKINRSGLLRFGAAEPSDGFWTEEDEISIRFNKNLDCAIVQDLNFIANNIQLINKSNYDAPVAFTMTCFANELIFELVEPIETYNGDTLSVTVSAVQGINGSGLLNPETWEFQVITQKLFFETDVIDITMYQGETQSLSVLLDNSTTGTQISNVMIVDIDQEAPLSNWISWSPDDFIVPFSGIDIEFILTASTIGSFSKTIKTTGSADGDPELTINLTVLPVPPNWDFDAGGFDNDMTVIVNWRFTDQAEGIISTDTMDRISVWIDGELRGVAKILSAGNDFYTATIGVLGHDDDGGKILDFRIWDATEGVEYDGHPSLTFTFLHNSIIGSTSVPQILIVDKDADIPRYIPLKGGQWNWFSINSTEDDMSLERQLRSLSMESDNDELKTNDGSAKFLEGSGWVPLNSNPLSALSPDKSYQIFLADGDDTLRVTGIDAVVNTIDLMSGFNWIGYPLQSAKPINDALNLTPNTGGNFIKTRQLDGNILTSDYTTLTGLWSPSLPEIEPFAGYKLFINSELPATQVYEGSSNTKGSDPIATIRNSSIPADPNDPDTWTISEYNFEYTMPLIATVSIEGITSEDTLDRLAIFSDGKLRGVGNIAHISALDEYQIGMLIVDTALNTECLLYFYDADTEIVYPVNDTLNFEEMGFGTFTEPYLIDIESFRSFVKPDGSDSNSGGSWEQAYQTIQKAVDVAKSGDEIWVAAGTYLPTKDVNGNEIGNSREKTFLFDFDVKIYGGFDGTEAMLTQRDRKNNITVLSGDFDQDDEGFVNNDENAFTVVYGQELTNDFVIDGFHIIGGNADDFGGGIGANVSGGGWYNDAISGSSNPTIINCIFSYNEGTSGGAFSSFGSEGGVSNPKLTNCVFHNNLATGEGGAMYNWGANGESSPELLNCTFSENTAYNSGGALFNNGNFGGASIPTITNSIFWNNTSPSGNSMAHSNGGANLTYTLLEESSCPNGMTCGMGMKYNQNPLLVDAVAGDLHLQSGSPALEAGINSAIPEELTEDIDGYDRITNGGVDLGAYELTDCYNSMIRIWSGASDEYWDNAGNWNCGVPTLMHDVTIPNLGMQVVLGLGKAGYCRTLTLEPGVIIELQTGSILHVKLP